MATPSCSGLFPRFSSVVSTSLTIHRPKKNLGFDIINPDESRNLSSTTGSQAGVKCRTSFNMTSDCSFKNGSIMNGSAINCFCTYDPRTKPSSLCHCFLCSSVIDEFSLNGVVRNRCSMNGSRTEISPDNDLIVDLSSLKKNSENGSFVNGFVCQNDILTYKSSDLEKSKLTDATKQIIPQESVAKSPNVQFPVKDSFPTDISLKTSYQLQNKEANRRISLYQRRKSNSSKKMFYRKEIKNVSRWKSYPVPYLSSGSSRTLLACATIAADVTSVTYATSVADAKSKFSNATPRADNICASRVIPSLSENTSFSDVTSFADVTSSSHTWQKNLCNSVRKSEDGKTKMISRSLESNSERFSNSPDSTSHANDKLGQISRKRTAVALHPNKESCVTSSHQSFDVCHKYWNETRLPPKDLLFVEPYWTNMRQMVTSYISYRQSLMELLQAQQHTGLQQMTCGGRREKEAEEMPTAVADWFRVAYDRVYSAYCLQCQGFYALDRRDQLTILDHGQPIGLVLLAAGYSHQSGIEIYRRHLANDLGVSAQLLDGHCQRMHMLSQRLRELTLDVFEESLICVLLVMATDYPNLKQPNLIEQHRCKILTTFQAYITAKEGSSSDRLKEILFHIPVIRQACVDLHRLLGSTTSSSCEDSGDVVKFFEKTSENFINRQTDFDVHDEKMHGLTSVSLWDLENLGEVKTKNLEDLCANRKHLIKKAKYLKRLHFPEVSGYSDRNSENIADGSDVMVNSGNRSEATSYKNSDIFHGYETEDPWTSDHPTQAIAVF